MYYVIIYNVNELIVLVRMFLTADKRHYLIVYQSREHTL